MKYEIIYDSVAPAKKRRRPKSPTKVRDFSDTKYVSPVKPKPRETAWRLYKLSGRRYK